MALISVVIPVHDVQGYLRQCLDSILDQPFADVQVIVVDDASTDGSSRILAEYAARDARVRTVTLDTNIGPGPARNAGLDRATGEYVWFVDGDDWLAPGALAAVADRLRETGPDVLVVDWVRVSWTGQVRRSATRRVFRDAPDVFALHDWPPLIGMLHVGWNKVVRRRLLHRLGFRFEAGWYEDLPYTYSVLSAAERISLLDRPCVHYRQRRLGAATRTAGHGHFAIFAAWARTHELVERCGRDPAAVRPVLFRQMIWHFLRVLANNQRIEGRSRREFFSRAHEHYAALLPPGGYPVPPGVEGVKHRCVARGCYRTFELLRVANRCRMWTKRTARRTGRRTRRAAGAVGAFALRLYYRLQLRLPADETLVLYSAYWHRGYACNPAAIYEKARELVPGLRGVWAVHRDRVPDLPPGVDFVISGTRAYHRALARAKYLVNNVNWPDWATKRRDAVHVMTHHGTPLKTMGLDQAQYPAGVKDPDFVAQMRRADRWDFSVSANAFTSEHWDSAYPCRHETLEVGYPRNDRLARATAREVAAVRDRLGIPAGTTVVLYAPTHREWQPTHRMLLDVEDLARRLGPGHLILVRAHYFYVKAGRGRAAGPGPVRDVSGYPVVEDLYLASDVLITDYSSLMFDYAVLDRPIVVFAPDWPAYRVVRGVYFDLFEEPPGVVTTTYPDLLEVFRTGAYADDRAAKTRLRFRQRFCYLDDGGAAERVVRRVFPAPAGAGARPGRAVTTS
ncbi:bifunctional glycosyltransferase/CDP-glycerol:glycerophosphate glycerophosphotransferase [Actinoplanes teichomyceticus]|uniref:CDP-glycerol glycerophosphotransferase (TagB/SpsB family) n=1 Tax=Actinoplanes teichomyceticus TaxID=1867 RepID=A0A561VL73_ACTTI|nr:bifunctional glycosyltransferase family 2 protein/CDP-glycerol:glycerophosphate glycerophosphotransferase [Actinoplanes teichomyceticus]TWG12373.1 CDP-glycerol glycerophosphotransferase (TagB/SpsB family) [Actinoplanes teichomyceticus]GIF13733.1 glycosyl transferase [Actinoplanes teichomyceticus]